MLDFFKNKVKEKTLLSNFVKEAKDRQKSSSAKNITLEQCKRDVARKYGYPSWNHLEDNIACKKSPNHIITTNVASPASGVVYLGYDVLLRNYRWLKNSDFQHTLILGPDRFSNYDNHLALQMIQQGSNVIFINGLGDNETLEKLVNEAKSCGREEDLAIYSMKGVEGYESYKKTLNTKFSNPNLFMDAMLGLIMFPESYDPAFQKWYNHAQTMLTYVAPLYIYGKQARDVRNKNHTYTFKELFEFLEVKNLRFEYNFMDRFPEDLRQNLYAYLNTLQVVNEENMDKAWEVHGWIIQMLNKVIQGINTCDLFDGDGDQLDAFFKPNEGRESFIKILHLNESDDSMKNMASYCFFAAAQDYAEFGKELELIEPDTVSISLFVREAPNDISPQFYSHARAKGIKFIYSYKDDESVNKYVLNPDGLLHNVNMSVVSLPHSDFYPDVESFPKLPHSESILLKKDGITLQLFLPK